ncbi:MAG: hypothetical protein VXZ82_18190 [Planctomycetota bacterium]|nr:hypothetical protein [Planctomycetota bacterium]
MRSESVWIPHAIIDDGVIIKLYDGAYHEELKIENERGLVNMQDYDRRWIRIRRPTVLAGGELTLDNLEIRHDVRTNTCEAPLQLKSNCGSLLIDDFGRQRVSPTELLNRWIVPLENKIDYLTLPTGKNISVPFEQLVLFSTNLQPADLVDEAFLRRVPFKIEIRDPSPNEFMYLFQLACSQFGFPWRPAIVQQLIEGYFIKGGRPLRRCYPRDLLKQVRAYCQYRSEPLDLRIDYLKHACKNYFGSLGTQMNGSLAAASQAVSVPVPSVNAPVPSTSPNERAATTEEEPSEAKQNSASRPVGATCPISVSPQEMPAG